MPEWKKICTTNLIDETQDCLVRRFHGQLQLINEVEELGMRVRGCIVLVRCGVANPVNQRQEV